MAGPPASPSGLRRSPPSRGRLPCKGRCQKPAPPEAGGPLHGTGRHARCSRSCRPTGPLPWRCPPQSRLCQPPHPTGATADYRRDHLCGGWSALICARPAPRLGFALVTPLACPVECTGRQGIAPSARTCRGGRACPLWITTRGIVALPPRRYRAHPAAATRVGRSCGVPQLRHPLLGDRAGPNAPGPALLGVC